MEFQFGEILRVLGSWGVAVLVGVMVFTETIKPPLRKSGVNDVVFVFMPCLVAIPGVFGLVLGGQIDKSMAVLVWFVVSFTGPALYRYILKPMLKKFGK